MNASLLSSKEVKVNMSPIVTVGVCARNSDDSIKEAIESIINQDFPHELMEVIFVDDGSEDNTLSIIQNHVSQMDIENKVFHGEWRGLGAARNTVVKNARGRYIVWVDADELLTKDHVRKQVEFMEDNPKVGIGAGCLSILPGENLILALQTIPTLIERTRWTVWKTNKRLPGTGGTIYRVEAIRQVGGFDDSISGVGEDVDAAYRIKATGWLVCRTQAVFYERNRAMATWKDLWNMYFRYGQGHYRLYCKNKTLLSPHKMIPPAGFVAGLLYSLTAYKFMYQKKVFLLPLHFAFKMTAWCLGFVKSHIESRHTTH